MSRTQPETRIVNHILDYCQRRGVKAIKIHGDAFTERGTPDVFVCWLGQFIAVEVKVPGENPEPIQVVRLQEWQQSGAIVGVAHSLEEFINITSGKQTWER